jgi:hypothetical protein|tara:strand:+ start:28984 stop:29103 length:120 start_codon:yes stop_codon:yes gene_type:complete
MWVWTAWQQTISEESLPHEDFGILGILTNIARHDSKACV